jgi:amino acid adenylation domain-containing protein
MIAKAHPERASRTRDSTLVMGRDDYPIDFGGPVDRPFDAFPRSALDGSIVDRFEMIVQRFPDRLAIQDHSGFITYRDLARLAWSICAAIVSEAAGRQGPIAILLNNDARYIAAILGVLGAGRSYVPLDPSAPHERNRLIAMQAGVCAVVCDRVLSKPLSGRLPPSMTIVEIDLLAPAAPRSDIRLRPAGIASIIFTSGSTGKPKGVAVSHRAVLHDVLQYTNTFHITPDDRVSMLYLAATSAGTRDIFGSLLNGASLHMMSPADLQTAGIVKELRARGVTVYHSVPGLLRRVVGGLGAGERLESVRIAHLSGARIEWRDIDACRRAFSRDVFVYVCLGSGESAYMYCHWFVDDSVRQTNVQPPVGRPTPDRTVMIVDQTGNRVVDGEVGEIWIKSRYIAECYWRAPKLTNSAFARDESDPLARVFRTGDLARRRSDGLIEFVGRKDRQVKLHGHRIEPGEVESALRDCQGVRDAAIHVRRNNDGVPTCLVAYVVPQPTVCGLLPRDVLRSVSQRLPKHMVPSQAVFIDELPQLPGLKVDLARLAAIDAGRAKMARQEQSATRALTDAERWLIALWKKVLKLAYSPSLQDNFFELGGDSIASAELISAIEERFSCQLPLEAFFQCPTVATLYELVEEQQSKPATSTPNGAHKLLHKLQAYSGSWRGERLFPGSLVVGLNCAGGRTPIFWVFQERSEFVRLARQLGPDQPLYAMRSCVGIIDPKDYSADIIETVCNRYLWEILALPVKAPFIVGGNCQGGIFALALARGLKQIGRTPTLLVLMEWTHSYGRYGESTLLLYGDQSHTAEIFLNPGMCAPNWREDFPRHTVAPIRGRHGHFFDDDNVSALANALISAQQG